MALKRYALLLHKLGRLDEAKSKYEELLEIDSNNQSALREYAFILYNQGLFVEAKSKYEELLEINSNNQSALREYAFILYNQGLFEEAKISFRKFIAVESTKDLPALRAYADTLLKINNFHEAKAQFEECLKIDSNDPFILSGYAETLDELGLFIQARNAYKKIYIREAECELILQKYKSLLKKIDRLEKEVADLGRLVTFIEKLKIELTPSLDKGHLLSYVEFNMALERLDLAETICLERIFVLPNGLNKQHYQYLLASILSRRGELDKARLVYEEFIPKIAHVDFLVTVLDEYAIFLLEVGDLKGAKLACEKALGKGLNNQSILITYNRVLSLLDID